MKVCADYIWSEALLHGWNSLPPGKSAATVADTLNRTGFPPVHLTEVNFQAMYESQLQQAAAAQQVQAS